jgi:hypothetical protein
MPAPSAAPREETSMYIGIGTIVVIVIIVLIVLFLRRLPLRRRMHSLYNPAFARDRDSVGPRERDADVVLSFR